MSVDLVHPEAGQAPFLFGLWAWDEPKRGEHFRRCNYCGSVHPDDLAAEPTWLPEWADRKYGWPHKFYVDIPNRNPDALFTIGTTNGDNPGTTYDGRASWVAIADLIDEQRAILARDGIGTEGTTYVLFGTRPYHFGKFYTTHLADLHISPQVKRTIERRSGLHFEFKAGRVSWMRAEP